MQLGQITKNNFIFNGEESINKTLAPTIARCKYPHGILGDIKESCIYYSIEKELKKFKKGETYYVKVNLKIKGDIQDNPIKVVLRDTEKNYEMLVRTIINIPDVENYYSFDFIFTPDRDYDYLFFVYTGRDKYSELGENSFSYVEIKSPEIKILYNIITALKNLNGYSYKDLVNIKEIGIQGAPGLRFSINGEDFKLGKSGYFYLSDVEISQVGFHVRESLDSNHSPFPYGDQEEFFIMSFQY